MINSATTNANFALRFSSVLSIVKIGNLAFSYMHGDNFQAPLKRLTSDRHKIFTTDWLWIEICQNAVWVKLVLKWQL